MSKSNLDKKLVCYFTGWSQYRDGIGKFKPKNIDPNFSDVLIFAYGLVENNQIKIIPNDNAIIDSIIENKKINSKLKVLLSVGGWENGSRPFSDMASNNESRKQFVDTTIDYVKKRGFDGIDLSWKFPAVRRGSRPEDKQNFTLLVKELKSACDKNDLILSAAISAAKHYIDNSYEIDEISRHLDWINLMTYDFHGDWSHKIGFNAPLYDRSEENDNDYSNIDAVVRYIVLKGVPREKIYLGLATYGRSFTLENENNRRPGDRAIRGGNPGEFTKEEGLLSYYYYEIRNNIEKDSWIEIFDPEQKVPFAYKGNQWVSFDNIQSIKLKAKYIVDQNLGGAHVWTLDFDDFKGVTGDFSKFPLVSAAKSVLKNLSEKTVEIDDSTKFDVFISYSWAQKETVDSLLYILEREGFKCWIDKSFLVPGSLLNKTIKNGILNSTLILACVSNEYFKSSSCSQELDFAKQNNKKIIPIMFDPGKHSDFNEEYKKSEIAFLLKSVILETGIYSYLTQPDVRDNYKSIKAVVDFIKFLKTQIG